MLWRPGSNVFCFVLINEMGGDAVTMSSLSSLKWHIYNRQATKHL